MSQTITDTEDVENFRPFSFNDIFRPTVWKASELMNVGSDVIFDWLEQAQIHIDNDDRLSIEAVDVLSRKYVAKMQRYFQNCLDTFTDMSAEDHRTFAEFNAKYGKTFHHVREWKDIDVKRIEKDFKQELQSSAFNDLFGTIECFAIDDYIEVREAPCIYGYEIYSSRPTTADILYSISRSILFNTHLRDKVPDSPLRRDICIETLYENRFHIFVDDSDDNGQIEARFTTTHKLFQPQIANIVNCGITRLQNIEYYGCQNKFQINHLRLA